MPRGRAIIEVPYGHPDQDSIYIYDVANSREKEFNNWVSFKFIKGLNQMSSFEIRFLDISSSEDKTYVKEGNYVKIFHENNLLFKGRIANVEYETDFYCTVKGFGMEILLNDYEMERKEYSNTNTDTIVNQMCSVNLDGSSPWIINVGKNTNWGSITFRGEYTTRLKFLANLADSIGWDWWASTGSDGNESYPFNTDYFHFDSWRGSSTSVKTFYTGGNNQNATLVKKEVDSDNIINYVKVLGYGDGVNQLKTSFYSASTVNSTLANSISSTDTTITLEDASSFPSSGTIRIAEEQISYTGKSGNNLTGCSRGVNGTIAKAHPKGVYVEKHVNITSPESGSSIDTYGLKEKTIEDRGLINEQAAELMASKMLMDYKDAIVRISLYVDDVGFSEVDVGDVVTINDTDTGLAEDYRVVQVERGNNERGEYYIFECSNSKIHLLSEIAETTKKTEKEVKYAMGSTIWIPINVAENCDSSHPLNYRIYIPSDVIAINKAKISFKMKDFRAYSTGSESATHTHSGFVTGTNTAGSNASSYSGQTGVSVGTNWVNLNSATGQTGWLNIMLLSIKDTGGSGGGNFSFRVYDGTNYYPDSTGVTVDLDDSGEQAAIIIWAGDMNGKTLTPQVKQTTGSSNTYNFDREYFVIGKHTHTIDITASGSHTHDILYGIYEETLTSPSVTLAVGIEGSESTIGTYTSDQTDIDISNAIKSVGSGNWVNIKFTPNKRMRIEAYGYIQIFFKTSSV